MRDDEDDEVEEIEEDDEVEEIDEDDEVEENDEDNDLHLGTDVADKYDNEQKLISHLTRKQINRINNLPEPTVPDSESATRRYSLRPMSRIIAPQRIAPSRKMGMLTNPNYFESMSAQRQQATDEDPLPTPAEIFEEQCWPAVDELCVPVAEKALRDYKKEEEKAKNTITIESSTTPDRSEDYIAVSPTALGFQRILDDDSISNASPSTQCSLPPQYPIGKCQLPSVKSSPTYRRERKAELDRLYNSALSINTEATTDDPQVCLLYTSPSPRDRQKSRMPSSA